MIRLEIKKLVEKYKNTCSSSSSSIYAKGHELLSMFDIDYHQHSQIITNMLMQHPDARFRLSLRRAPLKKKITGKENPRQLSKNHIKTPSSHRRKK